MTFHITHRLALALFAASATPAFAGDVADAPAGDPDTIVVTGTVDQLQLKRVSEAGSRLNLTPLETPASVEIIDGDAIRLRGDLTIQDAAARATGIVNTSGVFGFSLASRGFTGQNSVMQLYDGMRMYNNTLTFPADPWMAEAVEVLRGPASVLYGEGAIGGAVNVVRKQPTDTTVAAFRGMLGSFGFRTLGAGAGGPIDDRLGYQVDASYNGSDGWMDRGKSNAIALSGALRFRPTETLTLTVSHDLSRRNPQTWFGVPLVNGVLDRSIRKNNYNVTDARLRFRDDWTQLKLAWQPTDDFAVNSTFYHLSANKYWRNAENVTYVAPTATAPAAIRQGSFLELYHVQRQTGNRTTASYAQDFGGGLENRIVVGADVNHITYRNISNSGNNATRLVSVDNPVVGMFIDQPNAPTRTRYINTIRQFALFAEDRLAFTDWLSLVGGVRYDRPEIEKNDRINPANNFTRTPDAVTWRLGTVVNPVTDLSLYASFATAADPVGALVSTSLAQSDFDLSTGRQWEAGIKHVFWGGRGMWTFAAYDIVKKRLLTSDPLIPSIQVQVGQQSSKGLEASFFIEPVRGLSLNLNGSVLRARYDDFAESVGGVRFQRAGNRPTNVAAKTANAFASWAVTDRWVVDGGVSHVGPRFGDAANTRRLPAYTLTDLGVRWAFAQGLSAGARVRNLLDQTYPRATYGGTQWVLGDPRTVEFSVNAAF